MIKVTIPGISVAQARPRIIKKGNHLGMANTPEVTNYSAYAKFYLSQVRPMQLLDCPLVMDICVYVPRPKSARKRKYPATKPDADNFVKLICDCCEGLIYTNDSRIVDLCVKKRYSDEPRVELEIKEAE